MFKITTDDNKVVYLPNHSIKEIVIDPSANEAIITTNDKSYKTTATDVKESIDLNESKEIERLSATINNLTQLLRARLR
jgi:hypothetical protein